MRILHIDRQRQWAGQQTRTHLVARILRDRGDHVVYACMPGSGYEKHGAAAGLPVKTLWMRGGAWIAAAAIRVAALIRRERIEIVDAHGSIDHNVALVAARLAGGVPVVRTKHNHTLLHSRASKWTYARLTRRIITVSDFVRRILLEQGISPDHVETIPDAVDTAAIAAATEGPQRRAEARARFGIPEGAFALGTTSRNSPRKGLGFALDALAAIARERPQAKVVYVAAGCPEAEFKQYASDRGVPADMVRTPGFLERVTDLFPALDLFLLPSLDEGIGVGMLEALAADLPVVASAVGGIPEAVIDGETGLLVPPGDAAALGAAMRRMIDDRALAERLAAAGRARVRERFDIYRTADATRRCYEKVLAAGR